jgi:formate hydrogenlyase transcriptional activator
VRIIAATNKNLDREVKKENFRRDLFYRLNVFPIYIPPLRERKEDIPTLVWSFVDEMGGKMGKRIEKIPQQSIDALQNHDWPGNIRELRNVVERAMILSNDTTLRIPPLSQRADTPAENETIAEVERQHIIEVMEQTGWRVRGKGGAAEILDIKPTTLESRMQKLHIKRPREKLRYIVDASDIS